MDMQILTPGDKLKELRKKYGIKQHEISKNDISRNMISMIETNRANLIESTAKILIHNIKEICEKKSMEFDISLEYLLESAESQAEKIAKEFISLIDANPEKILGKDFQINLAEVTSILDKYGLKTHKSILYEKLGDFYKDQYNYHRAYSYYLTAFENYSNLFNNLNLINLIIGITYCCRKLNKHKESLEFNSLAKIYMPDLPMEESYKISYNNIISYKSLAEYETAINEIFNIEKSFNEILDSNVIRKINVLILKANCYTELKLYSKALEVHEQTLILTKDNIEMHLLILVNILDIYTKLNDSKNLRKYTNQCILYLNNYSKLEKKKYSSEIYNDIGNSLYFLKDYDQSKVYLNFAIVEAKKYNYIPIIEKSIATLLQIYILQNNEDHIDTLKTELFELISLKILPHNNDLVFKFINYYSSIKDNDAVADITSFVISQSPSE